MKLDKIKYLKKLDLNNKVYHYYDFAVLLKDMGVDVNQLPFSIRVLLEGAIRHYDDQKVSELHINRIAKWGTQGFSDEIPFQPARILLQDFTGVPAVVDLAAMRSAVHRAGGDPSQINPQVPVDLVIDHSVMVDAYGDSDALAYNINKEFQRNDERYRLLKWASDAFENFSVVPPSTGIIHQVNLEFLAKVAITSSKGDQQIVYPDTLVGTDSHTTMINGLGVLGWGVGGIEAEAAMLGQPIFIALPEVVGVKMVGSLAEGVTATDVALYVTELLRSEGVVGKFVEYFGSGVSTMNLADRATIANMAPEYGATMGYFPVDQETLNYLKLTGRSEDHIALVEAYYRASGLYNDGTGNRAYTSNLEINLNQIQSSLAGPKRPQDRIELGGMKERFYDVVSRSKSDGGYGVPADEVDVSYTADKDGLQLSHGSVVIAAITSCTNTSNPSVMIGAGLIAKKAVELGLKVPAYVKTSLTPGSKVVTDYLEKSGLLPYLEALGFYIAGYGCATCIGNSGPLKPEIEALIEQEDLTVASVLSGNRNFEGRVHAYVKANYLASPMLVVAYALAGSVKCDLSKDAIGISTSGNPVTLKDLWPSNDEIKTTIANSIQPSMFVEKYENIALSNNRFNQIDVPSGQLYEWDSASTYIQEPSFFKNLYRTEDQFEGYVGARALAVLGDSVTTDHISPAGSIGSNSPAGKYLQDKGIKPGDYNSYGSRRGNHEVMLRGTFGNIRLRNQLAKGKEGGYTTYLPTGEVTSIYDASMAYQQQRTPLIILAGKEYGTGSSRDWAAKGTSLLGVKAVIAESYERIHRSNLVGMGVLPLEFEGQDTIQTLGLIGDEHFTIKSLSGLLIAQGKLTVEAYRDNQLIVAFNVHLRLDSEVEKAYFLHGGILHQVLFELMAK